MQSRIFLSFAADVFAAIRSGRTNKGRDIYETFQLPDEWLMITNYEEFVICVHDLHIIFLLYGLKEGHTT